MSICGPVESLETASGSQLAWEVGFGGGGVNCVPLQTVENNGAGKTVKTGRIELDAPRSKN